MAEKDITEKILEAYDDVFADIVNGLLFDGRPVVTPDSLADHSPRSAYKADGKIREIERDVAKIWKKGRIHIACIGFENQTNPDSKMPMRVIGYDGAEYRAQLNREEDSHPVVTLVLYFGTKKRWDKAKSLHEAMDIPEEFKPFVQDYKINLFEIAYLEPEQVQLFKSDFRIVADYFVQKRMNGNYVPSADKIKHVQAVLQLLSVMTKDRRFEDVMMESQKGEVENMCEVLDKIEAKKEAEVNERVAKDMLRAGEPLKKIEMYSRLTEEAIRAVAQKLGIVVVQ